MKVPTMPPLNGRNLAEFYVASEATKRSTLRAYAKPPEEQRARIVMYDSVRRIVPEYFESGRDDAILSRTERHLAEKDFANPDFAQTWLKSNRAAIANLRALRLRGEFRDVIARLTKAEITVGKIRVLSTADFYATYVPAAANGKAKRVGVIVNPSGIRRPAEKRATWIAIECEVAIRAARAKGVEIDEVMYVDLPKNEIVRRTGPKKAIWAEIDATCERIFRDWREIRLEATQGETGTA